MNRIMVNIAVREGRTSMNGNINLIFSCGSNSINTAVCLSVFCSQFCKYVNETSTEARLAPGSSGVQFVCVANLKENENGEQSQTGNCQSNSRNSCSRIVLVLMLVLFVRKFSSLNFDMVDSMRKKNVRLDMSSCG